MPLGGLILRPATHRVTIDVLKLLLARRPQIISSKHFLCFYVNISRTVACTSERELCTCFRFDEKQVVLVEAGK